MTKKKWAKPMILLCIFLILVILYLALRSKNQQEEEAENAGIPILEMDSDSVTEVSFQINGEQVQFAKEEDTWVNANQSDFPVNQDKLIDLVADLTDTEADRVLSDVENLSEYGLEEPANTIVLKNADGEEKKLLVGSQNQGTGSYYLCLGANTSTVYVTDTDVSGNLPSNIMELAQSDSYPEISSTNVLEMRVDKSEGSYDLVKNEETTDWEVTGEDGTVYSAEYQTARSLASTLSDISYASLVDYNAEDMSLYGLNNPAASVYVKYEEEVEQEESDSSSSSSDSSAVSSSSSEEEPEMVEKEVTLYIGNQDTDGNYYVRLDGSSQVNTVSADTISTILDSDSISYWDTSIGYEYVKNMKSIQVTYQGEMKTIERTAEETEDEEGNTEETVTYTSGETTLDSDKVETFLSGMVSITAQSKDPDLTTTQDPEISITVVAENQTFTVTYAPYDSNFYLAIDSEGRPGLVNKNDVNEMIEEYSAIWS